MHHVQAVSPAPTDDPSLALSPDGSEIAFVANQDRVPVLWIRSLDSIENRVMAGTRGASAPFWSPDGRSIGFFEDDKLMRIDVAGGMPLVIADAPNARGGTWHTDGSGRCAKRDCHGQRFQHDRRSARDEEWSGRRCATFGYQHARPGRPRETIVRLRRASSTGMARLAINPADVTKVFLTHLHSDHIVSLPELVLFPWASQGRAKPLQVWGPDGTRSMVKHLLEAFSFDIRIRRDVDERFSSEGIRVIANDIHEGVVHEANGVKVTAFFVDHGPVKPAFGYRVDYDGHSVVISGDTKPSESLVKFSQNVDVLIHELGQSKQAPVLTGPPDELIPNSPLTRRQARTIADHHTDAAEAGHVFQRVQPRLAVFSHYPNIVAAEVLRLVAQSYAGRVELGEDMMTIEIGSAVNIRRLPPTNRQ